VTRRRAPRLDVLLSGAVKAAGRPAAFVLAGHNGSGKSTLWYDRLVTSLQMPLINADRLTTSILPEKKGNDGLPAWAQRLRDEEAGKGEAAALCENDLYGFNLDKLDPMAIAQNLAVEVEKAMGIYPNVPGLTFNDIGAASPNTGEKK